MTSQFFCLGKVASLNRTANELMNNGSFKEAVDAFGKVTDLAPDQGNAWFGLGYCLHMDGQIERAIEAHKKAAQFEQFSGIATFNLACAYSLQEETDQAISALKKAIELGFNDASQLKSDSDLDYIRDDRRFKELLKELD